jgi:hypothetical protein
MSSHLNQPPNACLQLRRAISIRAEGKQLLQKHAVAPSAAKALLGVAVEIMKLPWKPYVVPTPQRESMLQASNINPLADG